jgi:hypothetical protein
MKISLHPLRCVLAAATVALVFGFSPLSGQTANADLGESAGTIVVPSGTSAAEVQATIVAALSYRKWEIKAKTADRVVGYLRHGKNEATLTVIYDTTKVELYCVGWLVDKNTGAREKPEQPKRWLKYINEDLTRNLNHAVGSK